MPLHHGHRVSQPLHKLRPRNRGSSTAGAAEDQRRKGPLGSLAAALSASLKYLKGLLFCIHFSGRWSLKFHCRKYVFSLLVCVRLARGAAHQAVCPRLPRFEEVKKNVRIQSTRDRRRCVADRVYGTSTDYAGHAEIAKRGARDLDCHLARQKPRRGRGATRL